MKTTSAFDYQERGTVAVLTVHRSSRGLSLSDPDAMKDMWTFLDRAATSRCKVLLILFDAGALNAQRLDEAWEDIAHQYAKSQTLPPPIRALKTNIEKLIDYHQRSRLLVMAAFSGEVDLDLFGLLAVAHYRVCTADATIENNTLNRPAPPGAATVWFLSQMLGSAPTHDIFLHRESLTADDARRLNLVNDIAPADQLRQFAERKAEYFASKSEVALSTLVIALNSAHLDLTGYIEAIGTGFEAVLRKASQDGD